MDPTVARIQETAKIVRAARDTQLANYSQSDIIDALVEVGRLWGDTKYLPRLRAEAIDRPFPFAMTRVSLDGLLKSLTRDRLVDFVRHEKAWRRSGYPMVGHVIAGNTPLVSWTSIIRALLVRSGSLVKLPGQGRGSVIEWTRFFKQSLYAVKPSLGEFVGLVEWAPGTESQDEEYYKAFCDSSDIVMAYGSDRTINRLRELCDDKPFIGYGHRVSFALMLSAVDAPDVAEQLADDILIYDQAGCLSPQVCFVIGGEDRAERFAVELARALDRAVIRYPLQERHPHAARRVRDARSLAAMEGAKIYSDPGMRWSVILRRPREFVPSPTHGVISVIPLPHDALLEGVLAPVAKHLQGCILAGGAEETLRLEERLKKAGVSYTCRPGRAQAPPIDWPQDNISPLKVLIPPKAETPPQAGAQETQ